ncbi:MAG: heavy-metal-associated domain-containing protein [Bacteroidia bacterium]|nr:heavy-metal-associated domain-containing protein [Bacteroidia bacterium]
MKTEQIKIEGMTCGHCQKSVTKIIETVLGIISCEVSLEKGIAIVTFDEKKTTKEEIIKSVNDSEIYKAS